MSYTTIAEAVAIVVTGIAAFRKLVPALDGKWVLLAALLLAIAICVPDALGATLPVWAKGIRVAIEVAVLAAGGTEWATRLVQKIGTGDGDTSNASPTQPPKNEG